METAPSQQFTIPVPAPRPHPPEMYSASHVPIPTRWLMEEGLNILNFTLLIPSLLLRSAPSFLLFGRALAECTHDPVSAARRCRLYDIMLYFWDQLHYGKCPQCDSGGGRSQLPAPAQPSAGKGLLVETLHILSYADGAVFPQSFVSSRGICAPMKLSVGPTSAFFHTFTPFIANCV